MNTSLTLHKMHVPSMAILFFFIILSSIATLSSSSSIPEHNHTRFLKHGLHQNTSSQPKQYLEITRPPPFTNLTPSCTLPILTHDFAYTYGLPPAAVVYSPPANCTWNRVVLQFNASCKGEQSDRIAAVWLGGAEILRTSTAEPTAEGIFWTVTKDVTRYSSILVDENVALSVMLENLVNDVYTGVYRVNVTFIYYDTATNVTATLPLSSYVISNRKLLIESVEVVDNPIKMRVDDLISSSDEKPADLIVPISGSGDEGFWFRILNESELRGQRVVIPKNTYKAVLEIYVSFHAYDEFWYSNLPDSYFQLNNMTTRRGHGAYREVLVTVDKNLVGSFVPFPVIFTGGINPLFWEPLVSIGAFDLPSYDIDLTPFLGLLLDGKSHFLGLKVADSIPFWLVDANLHLWLDSNCTWPCEVQAKAIDHRAPEYEMERSSSFKGLDGKCEIELERKSKFSGWVNSTAGNFTTTVSRELKFKNKIKLKENGTEKKVKQKVKEEIEVRVTSDTGVTISRTTVKRKYPLSITTKTKSSTENGTSLRQSDLDQEWEEKKSGDLSSSLKNRQQSNGWMVVQDHNVLHGGATTQQSYSYKDETSCYSRTTSAANGKLINEAPNSLCAAPL